MLEAISFIRDLFRRKPIIIKGLEERLKQAATPLPRVIRSEQRAPVTPKVPPSSSTIIKSPFTELAEEGRLPAKVISGK